ncbi:MAG: DsbC family protein [Steroidobacteraceae bacterium]|nr:DsbC family protein [Steroidobacteraceae bacterium]
MNGFRVGTALLLGLAAATLSFTAQAENPQQAKPQADPRVAIAAKIPGTKPDDLRESPIPGVYELTQGTDIAYISSDGRYAIAGDLYDVESNDNLTEKSRRAERVKLISSVPESEMVVFAPKDPKYAITVFTDVDCTYCRKLHSQINEYNRLGIKVRYMFFPRSGPDTESWEKANEVWCSKDRKEALTRAKRGEALNAPKHCPNSPVARQYALGQDVGVRGTPAIVLANGEMLPGYLPPAMLAQHLRQK